MGLYPKEQCTVGQDKSVLQCNRVADKTVAVKPDLPGNIIVVHGVNDVGTAYDKVEEGLCAGLKARLSRGLSPASYRMPRADDKNKLLEDPDAVFFKRAISDDTHSPIIPFYWGYREAGDKAKTKNAQRTDRYGNRLDKDLSKGGGPFGNATNTLPDMWNRGIYAPVDVGGDPVRPVLTAPGRMYMVLAARRLAALVAMIRDYDPNDTVSIVAHSQGCLLSLLAQAFLLEQEGARPADTLVLTHPPYSLVDDMPWVMDAAEMLKGGEDAAMHDHYLAIAGRQTFDARLRTLANIVNGVAKHRHKTPQLTEIKDPGKHFGVVGARWEEGKDRDNRGKVYLYFCPEDMTVAINGMQGIGWQGVPDYMVGTVLSKTKKSEQRNLWGTATTWEQEVQRREPLAELGKSFFQRVFTAKKRLDPDKKAIGPVLVGQKPHDFALRIAGEDDHSHVAASLRAIRAHHTEATWPVQKTALGIIPIPKALQRDGIRTINGEELRNKVVADIRGSGQIDPKNFPKDSLQAALPDNEKGPCEEVDPIDAAIATTSGKGLNTLPPQTIDDPRPMAGRIPGHAPNGLGSGEVAQLEAALNQGKEEGDWCKVVRAAHVAGGKILLTRTETPNEARLRWQNEISPKSFHSSIFASKANHANVTAYDVAIGSGKASTDPQFYAYLCAVADWRLKMRKKGDVPRHGILLWSDFVADFARYWNVEPSWRKELIQGNAEYYSRGQLPACLPALPDGLPSTVVCETMLGKRSQGKGSKE